MKFETKLLAATLGAATLWASPAAAQATRTWVSGVGDDVNPCSRTAPCKTFAGAISKTAAGGEIDCLDPAGYGTLTITKSITIDCTGTFGSVLNSGGINGFVINDSATATPGTIEVRLRGLSINGAGTTPGLNGIRFISGRALYVENVFIQNQKNGAGIALQPTGSISVQLNNVSIVNGSTGILVQPTGTGVVKALISKTAVVGNASNGLRVDSASTSTAGIAVNVEDSAFSSNAAGISTNSTTRALTVMVNHTTLTNNGGAGISNNGASSTIVVGNTTITGNGAGITATAGAATFTYGDNRNDANPDFAAPNNGSFVLPALPKK
jgi:hypothetical protein